MRGRYVLPLRRQRANVPLRVRVRRLLPMRRGSDRSRRTGSSGCPMRIQALRLMIVTLSTRLSVIQKHGCIVQYFLL